MTREASIARTVQTSRGLVAGLVLAPLAMLPLYRLVSPIDSASRLIAPATLIGLLAPVFAWRLHTWWLEHRAGQGDLAARCAAYQNAVVVALAITEAAALLGVLAFVLSHHPAPLLGVVLHVLTAGAVWPSRDRLESLLG